MASLSHNLEYLATLSAVKMARALSAKSADRLGAGLGNIAYRVLTSRRRIAMENLQKAFGDSYSQQEREQITREVFRNLARTLIEFSRFGKTTQDDLRRIIVGPGREVFSKVLKEGKGGILVTAHFGNWEMLGIWPATCGFPTDLLIGRQHNPKVDDLLVSFRRSMNVGIIPLATSSRQAFKALRANHIAGIGSDQHSSSGGVVLDFFGRPAATPKGPALFSIRTGSPLIPIVLRRENYERHVLMPGEPIYPPNSGDEEADIAAMTIAYTKFFEQAIRQYPEQWMWTHRRWKIA
jgi:Kdo2-lipid IVA lauroyltransferase/acyltransferase